MHNKWVFNPFWNKKKFTIWFHNYLKNICMQASLYECILRKSWSTEGKDPVNNWSHLKYTWLSKQQSSQVMWPPSAHWGEEQSLVGERLDGKLTTLSISNFNYLLYTFQEIKKIRSAILGKDNCRINELPHMVGFSHTGSIGGSHVPFSLKLNHSFPH